MSVVQATAQVESAVDSENSPFTPGPRNGQRVTVGALARFSDPKKTAFLSAFATCGIVLDGCQAAEICRATVDNWRRADPEFARFFENAKEDAADNLERHAIWRATHAKRPSDILCIFLLKGMRPMKYRDNVAISGHDGGPLFRMVAGVSPQRVCGVEHEPKLTKSKAKALLESDVVKAVEPVKS